MRCNLCGCEIEGYGNNPAPLIENDDDRCCDLCDSKYVIPARIYTLSHRLDADDIANCIFNIRIDEDFFPKMINNKKGA